jgi:membrane fusion protein (multidrug efflux system)
LRLEGFPWPQYGSIPARVQSVANEPDEGKLRVELAVQSDRAVLIPVQHGLSGSVEVQVERVSPARLVWRIVGKLLSAPHRQPEAPTATSAKGGV